MMDYSVGFLKEKEINQGLSYKTIKVYKVLFRHIERSSYLDLSDLSTFTLENTLKFFAANAKKRQPSCYNHYRKNFNCFVKYLVREYGIYDFSHLFRAQKQGKKLPKLFENNEINKLLFSMTEREQNVFKFFMYTGIRCMEFKALEKTDISGGIIRIRHGKGDKERLIPVHPELQKILHKVDYNYSNYFLEKLSTKCKKIVKRFHWHRCRHTFATALVRNGVDIYAVSLLLGHSDISTTTIYLSLDLEKKREALNKLHF